MEYTIKKMAELAGVSTRTLRYYNEIGLLRPARVNSSGYRLYGASQAERLQQVLLYREMGIPLDQIATLLDAPDFDNRSALLLHRETLLKERRRIDTLIANVDKSIAAGKGECTMNDKERFEGFKRGLVEENERKYGEEIRTAYGSTAVEEANRQLLNLPREEYERGKQLEQEIRELLELAWKEGDPLSRTARQLALTHKEWLCLYWASYSPQAHAGLARMYVEDRRFSQYYDPQDKYPGKVEFLRDAILAFAEGK